MPDLRPSVDRMACVTGVKGWRLVVERVQLRRLMARRVNTERKQLLRSLIIHLGASCFLSVRTAAELNCLEINSLACYWLHTASEVHLSRGHPIMLAEMRRLAAEVSVAAGAPPIIQHSCLCICRASAKAT